MPHTKQSLDKCLQLYKISLRRFNKEKALLMKLSFDEEQAEKLILRSSSQNTVSTLLDAMPELTKTLSHSQIIKIAARSGGKSNIKSYLVTHADLRAANFSSDHLVRILSHNEGAKKIHAVKESLDALQALEFSLEDITKLVSRKRGSQTLYAIKESHEILQALGFTAKNILRLISYNNDFNNLYMIKTYYPSLKALGFAAEQIINLICCSDGLCNLHAIQENYQILQALGLNSTYIVCLLDCDGGYHNIYTISKHYSAILQAQLSPAHILHILSQHSTSQAAIYLVNTLSMQRNLAVTQLLSSLQHLGRDNMQSSAAANTPPSVGATRSRPEADAQSDIEEWVSKRARVEQFTDNPYMFRGLTCPDRTLSLGSQAQLNISANALSAVDSPSLITGSTRTFSLNPYSQAQSSVNEPATALTADSHLVIADSTRIFSLTPCSQAQSNEDEPSAGLSSYSHSL